MSTTHVPPTLESVADMFTAGDNDFLDGDGWKLSLTAKENVVSIGITPFDEEGEPVDEVHFRAVVVEGDETPIVLEPPAELGIAGEYGEDLLSLTSDGIRIRPPELGWFDLTPGEAREWAAHLAAMADAYEAAQSNTGEADTRG